MFDLALGTRELVKDYLRLLRDKYNRELSALEKANELKEKELRIECFKIGVGYNDERL